MQLAGELGYLPGQLGVLLEHPRVLLGQGLVLDQHLRLTGLELGDALGLGLAVGLQGFVAHLVAVGLTCLSQQDQRRGVGGLQREGEVQRDERVLVPGDRVGDGQRVEQDPEDDDARLPLNNSSDSVG